MFIYNSADEYAEKNLLIADIMGIESEADFYYKRDFVDSYIIMCTTKGTLNIWQFDRLYELEAGQGILMDLRKPHTYCFENGIDCEIYWFHFHGFIGDRMLGDSGCADKMPLIFNSGDVFSDINKLFHDSKHHCAEKAFHISHIIYGIILKVLQQQFHKTAVQSDFCTAAQEYILSNIGEEINLDDFSRTLNLSKSYFCRHFKRAFGITATAYIQNEKVELAKKLLINTNKRVAEISATLGFYDQSHFSHVFSGIVGVPPGVFRKKRDTF